MSERDLTAIERDRIAEWDRASVGRAERTGEPSRAGVAGWVETRLQAAVAHLVDGFSRRSTDLVDSEDAAPLSRTGGAIARWISFPRGVRFATAATSSAAAALAAWGMIAMAANNLGIAAAAAGAATALSAAWGPLGVRMANRIHHLVARRRLHRIRICAASLMRARSLCAAWSSPAARPPRRWKGAPRSGHSPGFGAAARSPPASFTRRDSTFFSMTGPTSRSGSRSRGECCSTRFRTRSGSSFTARRCWRSTTRS